MLKHGKSRSDVFPSRRGQRFPELQRWQPPSAAGATPVAFASWTMGISAGWWVFTISHLVLSAYLVHIYIYVMYMYVIIYISYTRYGDFSTVLKLEAHDSTINHWFPEMNWVHDHFWAYFHEFTDLSFNAINVYKEFATGTGTLTVVCLNI